MVISLGCFRESRCELRLDARPRLYPSASTVTEIMYPESETRLVHRSRVSDFLRYNPSLRIQHRRIQTVNHRELNQSFNKLLIPTTACGEHENPQ